ncbi:MAG: glycosyltransferase, partial [Candidatus Latescibacteria bacterium]|nr:glycosyltransferase [Candidatus Latescibacterota bacterium]
MAKADLHVHSKFSNHPSEWFLQRIGASECYTDPEYIYQTAKKRGMSFVTITDHNSIDGALQMKEKHPEDFFIGMEATTYFPEDECKIHVLIYGLNESEFSDIQKYRTNIYDLRDYLKEKNLAHSVAHGIYSVNGKLIFDHLEKLILLFDIFEGINGGRNKLNNQPWAYALRNLTPVHIEKLANKHDIEPFSSTPWIKGFTGGSDDHAGLFMGQTYTNAEAQNIFGFLDNIRNKQSTCEGRYSNYQSLAFTIYKIAFEFSKTKSDKFSQSFVSQLTEHLFESSTKGLKNSLKLKTYKTFKGRGNGKSTIQEMYWDLFDNITKNKEVPIEDKLDEFYDRLALISDEFSKIMLTSLENNLYQGDFHGLLKNISSSIPGIFLAIPFLSTLKHFYQSKNVANNINRQLGIETPKKSKKILWFTDTLTYMNGVSMTVRKIGWLSYLKGKDLNIVTSMPGETLNHEFPPNVINLPYFYEFKLPHYEHYLLRVPSFLQAIKKLYTYEPDEIYISTPGPVGLFGIIVARLLNAKSVCVFHTDFTKQAHEIIDDSSLENLIENYLKWFNSLVDEVQVPTNEYINILELRGYDTSKMILFRRGIDTLQFSHKKSGKKILRDRYNLPEGITLIYAGRISKDKNLEFLIETYNNIHIIYPDLNLIIAGDGPDLNSLK